MGSVFISAVISYSLVYDIIDIVNNYNSPDSNQFCTDKDVQEAINRAHSLNQAMEDNPPESSDDYSTHNSKRDKEYVLLFII